jgi:hypothetical protein
MAEQSGPTLTRHDLDAKIVKRSWENKAFREEFSSDPMGTAAKYLKVPAAELPKIVVHEETAGTWHIVIPAKPANAKELSEADLERVAGGAWVYLETPGYLAVRIAAGAAASAAVVSGVGSLIAGENVDTGW